MSEFDEAFKIAISAFLILLITGFYVAYWVNFYCGTYIIGTGNGVLVGYLLFPEDE